jgi:hypothetical protein
VGTSSEAFNKPLARSTPTTPLCSADLSKVHHFVRVFHRCMFSRVSLCYVRASLISQDFVRWISRPFTSSLCGKVFRSSKWLSIWPRTNLLKGILPVKQMLSRELSVELPLNYFSMLHLNIPKRMKPLFGGGHASSLTGSRKSAAHAER